MAGADRQPSPDVTPPPAAAFLDRLAAEPWRFDLFQALRVLEAAHPGHAALGEGRRATQEPVRLSQPPELGFAPSDVAAFERREHDGVPQLRTHVIGLFGPSGPLPLHLTVHARERRRNAGDPTFADFADIFHHRMLALFYRAWATARPTVERDRGPHDRFRQRLAALVGIGPRALRTRHAVPDEFTLLIAGLVLLGSRPPEALGNAIRLLFAVPVTILELQGAWLDIPLHRRSKLGAARLGADAIVGIATFQRAHRFRIRLGPLTSASFVHFLPDARTETGRALPMLVALVRFLAGLELDWDLQLVLRRDEVPTARLDGGTRLGWTSWLAAGSRPDDADDLVLAGLLEEER